MPRSEKKKKARRRGKESFFFRVKAEEKKGNKGTPSHCGKRRKKEGKKSKAAERIFSCPVDRRRKRGEGAGRREIFLPSDPGTKEKGKKIGVGRGKKAQREILRPLPWRKKVFFLL